LRILVGFSWLINGLDKILDPSYDGASLQPMLAGWSASGHGALSTFVSSNLLPHVGVVAFLLKAGEVAIGVALITGIVGRLAAFGGFIIVAGAWLFKGSYDSMFGYAGGNFIIMVTMLFLTFAPTGLVWRIDRFFPRGRPLHDTVVPPAHPAPPPPVEGGEPIPPIVTPR
jgi:thiosulfate dehydrogenase [quinone] large subunit